MERKNEPPTVRDLEGRVVPFEVAKKVRAHQRRRLAGRSDPAYDHDTGGDLCSDMSGSIDDHYGDLREWGVEFDDEEGAGR